ncbi:MAG: hypothetical protein KJO69_05755, partial [Gammaproteobacteria bacterium]|nr:hypothetical protein [Gammaproteobacteria bacterium]
MDFVNSMSMELHIYLELISSAMLLMMAWLNHTYHASGDYSKIMTIGLVIASMEDLLHAVAICCIPDILHYWVPFSWALTRFTLLLTFFVAISCTH